MTEETGVELIVRKFTELSAEELFEIYKLRVAVFVVEQNCPYQDIDDFDKAALHMFYRENGRILAYLRVLPAGTAFDEVSIGRVIAVERRKGFATRLVSEGLRTAVSSLGTDTVVLEAQTYARGLYEKLGFIRISDEFLEDGIPHIKMRWSAGAAEHE